MANDTTDLKQTRKTLSRKWIGVAIIVVSAILIGYQVNKLIPFLRASDNPYADQAYVLLWGYEGERPPIVVSPTRIAEILEEFPWQCINRRWDGTCMEIRFYERVAEDKFSVMSRRFEYAASGPTATVETSTVAWITADGICQRLEDVRQSLTITSGRHDAVSEVERVLTNRYYKWEAVADLGCALYTAVSHDADRNLYTGEFFESLAIEHFMADDEIKYFKSWKTDVEFLTTEPTL